MSNEANQIEEWLVAFEAAVNAGRVEAVVSMFSAGECFWRDLVAFTWTIATMDGPGAIASMLHEQLGQLGRICILHDSEQVVGNRVEGWFNFETATARGKGHIRLRDGKCWTLLTSITELKGFEERAGQRRPLGVEHKVSRERLTWLEEREREEQTLGAEIQPYCLVIGAGQGGLALGARLKMLNVPTLIVDALPRPGDAWRRRYKSLYLHDPVWSNHLPYIPFPDHWPVFMSKDKIADWLEMYAKAMELNIWCSANVRSAHFDDRNNEWVVNVERESGTVVLRPKQLVIATGLSGKPKIPALPGAESFGGVQYHSSEHRESESLAGKRVIVLGSNNSAHDICADLWTVDADVTMIQRSSTTVVKADATPPDDASTERRDLLSASMPYRVRERYQRQDCDEIQRGNATFYAQLRAAGFLLDFGEDGTGQVAKYYRRASGYYLDVGASDLIISGQIKVRSATTIEEIRQKSVVLSDGSELDADAIIYATGFEPMESWIGALISKDCEQRVGRCWGLGSDTAMDPGPWEGELRNMWKPTAQEGLWFQGGALFQARFHSLHLALQIKARFEKLPVSVHQPRPINRSPGTQ
ncbi:NAD(P)/FAD-dependent oxidoreductase [Mesorhizobium sp. M1050]|uniref:flavin-containing monooxygenase n=1 Tax=Mesorhizobium sp. M1050 TaxID=2957051 RepID=UPI00333C8FEB